VQALKKVPFSKGAFFLPVLFEKSKARLERDAVLR
jgi:hypothetical protein